MPLPRPATPVRTTTFWWPTSFAWTTPRAAGRALTLGDLFLLVEAVTRDTGAPRELGLRLAGQVDTALRCDANSTTALRDLASMARGSVALDGEGRALLASAAAELATHDLNRDEACRA